PHHRRTADAAAAAGPHPGGPGTLVFRAARADLASGSPTTGVPRLDGTDLVALGGGRGGARPRHVDGVATNDFDYGGARPLGHEALARRRDHPVLCPTGYQLGLARQGRSVTTPARAFTPHGTCESAMKAARSAGRSAAKDA